LTTVNQKSNGFEEEVNLHDLLLILKRSWVTIVAVMLIGGLLAGAFHFLKKPSYQATAVISVNSSKLLSKTTPIFLIQSDKIKNKVAKNLNLKLAVLSDVTFSTVAADKTIINITAKTNDSGLSINIVNNWATTAINSINGVNATAQAELDDAQKIVDSTDSDLLAYLQKNGLSELTWADLVAITGVEDGNSTIIVDNTKTYPSLTANQKIDLAGLIRQKVNAEWNYGQVRSDVYSNTVPSQDRATMINKALGSERDGQELDYLIIPLGILCGFSVAVIWILFHDWWKKSQREHNSSNLPQ
jgi:capsular polysaccharide biosynthesis protein